MIESTHPLSFLVLPFNQGVVDKCVQNARQTLLVLPQKPHRDFASDPKHSFNPSDTQPVDEVLGKPEGYSFRGFEMLSLLTRQQVSIWAVE